MRLDTNSDVVARKYACAFLDYFDLYNRDVDFLLKIDALVVFLGRYRSHLFYAKKEVYKKLFELFGLDVRAFCVLLDLLLQDKRIFLLRDVLQFVCMLFKQHKGIEQCTIKSSHPLSSHDYERVHTFLEKASGKKVIYSPFVDKSLIAGIRVEADTFLWEDSIAKQLRLIEQLYQ